MTTSCVSLAESTVALTKPIRQWLLSGIVENFRPVIVTSVPISPVVGVIEEITGALSGSVGPVDSSLPQDRTKNAASNTAIPNPLIKQDRLIIFLMTSL